MAYPNYNRKLSGLNTLAYMGVDPTTPPDLVIETRRPTIHDYLEFNIGDFWLVKGTEEVWILVAKDNRIANWVMLTSGDLTFHADDGNNAYPQIGVINIVGGLNIDTSCIPPDGQNVVIALQNDINIPGTVHISSLMVPGVLQTDATGLLITSNGTNGQVMIGGGGAPVWRNLTSSDLSITITNGANSIDLVAVGGGGGGFAGLIDDAGVTATPDLAHKVTVTGVGGVGITTAATPGVLTLSIGGSVADGQLLIGNAGGTASWANLTSTGGSVTITNGPGSAINLEAAGVAALTALTADDANDATPLAGKVTIHGSEVPAWVIGQPLITTTAAVANQLDVNLNYPLTDGAILICSSAGVPRWANITGSATVTVTNNHNSITLTAAGGGGGSGVQVFDCISGTATPNPATPTLIYIEGDALPTSGGYNNITTRGTADLVEIILQPRIYLPNTNVSGTTGVLYLNNIRFLHNYGTANTFYGAAAGNFTLTTANAINNTGIGYHALTALTGTAGSKAANNTALGYNALAACTDGYQNTAIGATAADTLTTGFANTAVGYAALTSATTGSWNTALGHQALNKDTASQNTAVGYAASYNNTTGTYNVSMGYHALFTNVTGNYTTAIGHSSLENSTAGSNTAIGYQSAQALTTGTDNVIIGIGALKNGTSASANIAIGNSAMGTGVTIGGANIAIGDHAMPNITGGGGHGVRNIAIGYNAANAVTVADSNVIIGDEAASLLLDGTNNVVVGSQAIANASVDRAVIIGEGASGSQQQGVSLGSGAIVAGAIPNQDAISIGHGSYSAGNADISIGLNAGNLSSGAGSNIRIGTNAGKDGVGGGNIFIGTDAGHNAGAGSGNTYLNSGGVGGENFTIRIDESSASACYIGGIYNTPAVLGDKTVYIDANNRLKSTQSGLINQSFLYIQIGDIPNVTGDGTTYRLGSTFALTQIFDATVPNVTAFSASGAYFTAPATGRYFLMLSAMATNLFPPAPPAAFSTPYSIVTTRRRYDLVNSIFQAQTNGNQSYSVSCIADMDLGDRAYFEFDVNYLGVKNIGCGGAINITSPCATFISGFLIP